jgi:predicted transcriptional regulator
MNGLPLWKRCRVLANPVRLKLLAQLDQKPRQYVKAIAQTLGLAEDVASKNLQMLASAGFLEYERVGKFLYYSLSVSDELLCPVLAEIRKKGFDVNRVMSMLTALTHERRIAIVKALCRGCAEWDVLRRQTRISRLATDRHLNKLMRRGWVQVENDLCELMTPDNRLGLALIEVVKKSVTPAQV